MMKQCTKCGTMFESKSDKVSQVMMILCHKCVHKWLTFYEHNHQFYIEKYPKRNNPTWDAFLGRLLDNKTEKEIVQFT